jgi:hypothetical protein
MRTRLTTSWALYSTTITTITGTTGFLLEQVPFPASPYTIYFAFPQVTAGACSAASVYVPTGTTPISAQIGDFAPTFDAGAYLTSTNCMSTASPTCGSSAAGAFSIAVSGTSTTVSTTAVTAASSIEVTPDESVGAALGVTCNTTAATALAGGGVTARVAGTSFTYSTSATVTTNPVCFSYHIIN